MIYEALPVLVAGMLSMALLAVARVPAPPAEGHPPVTSRVLQGSWSAVGWRHTLATEGSRKAAVVQVSGAIALTDEVSVTYH